MVNLVGFGRNSGIADQNLADRVRETNRDRLRKVTLRQYAGKLDRITVEILAHPLQDHRRHGLSHCQSLLRRQVLRTILDVIQLPKHRQQHTCLLG